VQKYDATEKFEKASAIETLESDETPLKKLREE
jgi:hypothetical protein